MTQPRRSQVIDYFNKHIKFTYPKQKVRRKEFLLSKKRTPILSYQRKYIYRVGR